MKITVTFEVKSKDFNLSPIEAKSKDFNLSPIEVQFPSVISSLVRESRRLYNPHYIYAPLRDESTRGRT